MARVNGTGVPHLHAVPDASPPRTSPGSMLPLCADLTLAEGAEDVNVALVVPTGTGHEPAVPLFGMCALLRISADRCRHRGDHKGAQAMEDLILRLAEIRCDLPSVMHACVSADDMPLLSTLTFLINLI